mmetsp:Transcript_5331/g.15773  ORF Transcript_5331/g.15773 Transcript_5331/m.15773 type:complete len:119 (+) Transcript_5331:162-518(+)
MLLLWLLATLLSSTTTESAQPQRRPPLYDLLTIQHHTTCVVTAGFNVEATIGESTRSVIQQRDVHLVFVDDGSSDDSVCAFRAAPVSGKTKSDGAPSTQGLRRRCRRHLGHTRGAAIQ